MPVRTERFTTATARVAPSAPVELMWVVNDCEAGHPLLGPFASLEPVRLEMKATLDAFWGDGVRGFTEAVVLAQRSGALFDADLTSFLDGLDAACSSSGTPPSLLSETDQERVALRKRLERLRTEPELRARYIELLRSVWDLVGPEWRSAGLPAVKDAQAEWITRLADGVSFRELLSRAELWPGRPDLDELADAAAAEGRLVLTPSWFGGDIHIVELDGIVCLGRGVRHPDDDQRRWDTAVYVSSRLKALADSTRLAILLRLAKEPASVTELARHFKLSQPTISGHVHVLREAGLLEERTLGRSSKLSASEDDLRKLFAGTQDAMVKLFRH
ncbi:MAG TPA: metalloregulator ArsR/SmtB family transcription factor [Candidatus Sulfotelmatobacter sp.]|nr:metalloregulator ArsR/SmtB family transcription factor [Candidatus Sulfotelmatobacter sp.]